MGARSGAAGAQAPIGGSPLAKTRSHADKYLAESIREETGISVSGWQIERWRQHGLLAPADHEYPGGGSIATYREETKAQAEALARLSKKYRRYDQLARILHYRGFEVDEAELVSSSSGTRRVPSAAAHRGLARRQRNGSRVASRGRAKAYPSIRRSIQAAGYDRPWTQLGAEETPRGA